MRETEVAMPNSAHETYEPLTKDEADLTRMLAEGKTAPEMAAAFAKPVRWVRDQLNGLAARLRTG